MVEVILRSGVSVFIDEDYSEVESEWDLAIENEQDIFFGGDTKDRWQFQTYEVAAIVEHNDEEEDEEVDPWDEDEEDEDEWDDDEDEDEDDDEIE